MEGATDLNDLLGQSPVQKFSPMVTAGDPFISPIESKSTRPVKDYSQQFSILQGSFRHLFSYLSFFLAAMVMSLSKPRELILPYIPIPSIYGEGGVLTYTGAAVIGALSTILAYVINTVLHTLI